MGGRAALPPLLGRDGAEILEEGVRRSGGAASIRRRSGESSVPVEASRDLTLPLAACSVAVRPDCADSSQIQSSGRPRPGGPIAGARRGNGPSHTRLHEVAITGFGGWQSPLSREGFTSYPSRREGRIRLQVGQIGCRLRRIRTFRRKRRRDDAPDQCTDACNCRRAHVDQTTETPLIRKILEHNAAPTAHTFRQSHSDCATWTSPSAERDFDQRCKSAGRLSWVMAVPSGCTCQMAFAISIISP
jgi:hypothetical protein